MEGVVADASRLGVANHVECDVCRGKILANAQVCRHCGTARDPTRRCPNCQAYTEEGARICRHCTMDLGVTTHCKSCGTPILASAHRCRHCEAEQGVGRRALQYAVPILSLVVALIAIFSNMISDLIYERFLRGVRVEVSEARVNGPGLLLMLHNTGRRDVNFGDGEGEFSKAVSVSCDVLHVGELFATVELISEDAVTIPNISAPTPILFSSFTLRYVSDPSLSVINDRDTLWMATRQLPGPPQEPSIARWRGETVHLQCRMSLDADHVREGFRAEDVSFVMAHSHGLGLSLLPELP